MNEIMYANALHILSRSVKLTVLLLLLLVVIGATYRVIATGNPPAVERSSCGPGWLVREGFLEEGRVVLGWLWKDEQSLGEQKGGVSVKVRRGNV